MNAVARFVFGGICYWLFFLSVLLSGVTGVWLPLRFCDFWTWPVAMPVVAMIAFFVAYRIIVLGAVGLVERAKHIELQKPSVGKGILYSAILTFVIAAAFIFLAIVGLGEFLSGHGH